jgi:protein TonB
MTTVTPITSAPISRWPGACPARRPSAACWGGATLLHVAVGVLVLATVRLAVAPPPSTDHTIALVFAPSPPAAPPPVPSPPEPAPVSPPDAPPPPVPVAALLPAPSPPEAAAVSPPDAPPPVPVAAPPLTAVPPPPVQPRPPPKRPPVRPRTVVAAPPRSPVVASARPPTPELSSTPAPQPAPQKPATPAPIALDWQRALTSWLATHKTYPDDARRSGTEGNVEVRFSVDRSGHVLDVTIVHGAGSAVLDAAAEAMLRGATLPAFPDSMSLERITVTVRLRYALTN